ncbi:hypothetical protein MMC30_008960 [Trapelia coarctata]|nr:hypothetical protein [Trapelia coarctata]
MQGSEDDWMAEAVTMHLVYTHSYLNIAASASSSGSGGLFRPWSDRLLETCCFKHTDDKWYSHDRFGDSDLFKHSFRFSPLHRRAWIVQELFLSPRTLHFTDLQLYWQCKSRVECGAANCELPHMWNGRPLTNTYAVDDAHPRNSGGSWLQLWYRLAEDYSRSLLTYAEDKIIAFDGVTQYFCRPRVDSVEGEEYLAGLWMSDLWTSLLWYPVYASDTAPMKVGKQDSVSWDSADLKPLLGLREPYMAPSWSWLSITGPVTWGIPVTWNLWFNYKDDDYVPCAQMIEKQSKSDGHRVYATLTLEAPSFRINIRKMRPFLPDMNEEPAPIQLLYDGPEYAAPDGEYLCIATIHRCEANYLQRGILVSEASAQESAPMQRNIELRPGAPHYMRRGVWASEPFPYGNGSGMVTINPEAQPSQLEHLARLYQESTSTRRVTLL